jgi:hypothetical protein
VMGLVAAEFWNLVFQFKTERSEWLLDKAGVLHRRRGLHDA